MKTSDAPNQQIFNLLGDAIESQDLIMHTDKAALFQGPSTPKTLYNMDHESQIKPQELALVTGIVME